MDNLTTLSLNIRRRAITQYCNFPAVSAVVIGDTVLLTDGTTLFELTGDDDNGTAISAFFEFPNNDYTEERIKRIRNFIMGYKTDGELSLEVTDEKGNVITLSIPTSRDDLKPVRVRCSRRINGRFIKLKITNVNGSDFLFTSMIADMLILVKKE